MLQHAQGLAERPVTVLLRDHDAVKRYPGAITLEYITSAADPVLCPVLIPARPVQQASDGGRLIRRLLLSCKAQDAQAAFDSVSPFLADDALIVLLQNGIRFQQQLSCQRPQGNVFCLSTSYGAWLRHPYHTVAAGTGESWLGHLYDYTTPGLHNRLRQLQSELPADTMKINIDLNMSHRLWEKLAINCAINGLTVIYDCRNGELLSRQHAREHCQALCDEITTLLKAIPQAPELPGLWQRVQQVAQATASNISSTLQDIRHQRQTEIEHLNGYLCDLAVQHGLPCPLNQQVVHAVLESTQRSQTTRAPVA